MIASQCSCHIIDPRRDIWAGRTDEPEVSAAFAPLAIIAGLISIAFLCAFGASAVFGLNVRDPL